jgi:formate dehydrogenase subunit gamma
MFRLLVLAGIAAVIAATLGHFLVFGPKRVPAGKDGLIVRRFSIWERFIHTITVLGFLLLALTGFYSVVVLGSPLHGWLWVLHIASAPLFGIGVLLMLMTWAKDGCFAACDWEWALKFGGYLWGDKHAPAERFNGGQKGYFWMAAALGFVMLVTGLGRAVPLLDTTGQEVLYQIHRFAALLFILAGLGHMYLGTFANPGSFGAMLTGKVTPEWAKNHHPLWWKALSGEKKDEK